MNNKLGLASVSFRKKTAQEILEAMKQCGLMYIEWGSDVHAPPEKAKELAALTKKYDIICCSYGTYFRLGITPLTELEEYIEAARVLGTNVLRLWCGNKNSEDYTQDEKTALFNECKRASDIAEKKDVILCMECHNKTYTNAKEATVELMHAVSSDNFKMYWQPNEYKSERENIEYAKAVAPFTVNIHVFNWEEKNKYPLADAKDIWREYISYFDDSNTLLLEFMPDGQIDTLKNEMNTLKEIVK